MLTCLIDHCMLPYFRLYTPWGWASLIAQLVKNPPEVQETWVQSLGWKDPLEKGYGCESWAVKKAECRRIDAFELWCWRRLSRVPWTARRSSHGNPKGNQSWIFIGRTEAAAKAPILWPPDAKNWLTGKTLMLGKIEGGRKREQQKTRWLDGITNSMNMSLSKLGDGEGQESPACCSPWGRKVLDMTEQLKTNCRTQNKISLFNPLL